MQPLWIAFPRIRWGSIGWRMGAGEDYWHAWTAWFRSLHQAERDAYKAQWREPDGWNDFYSFIETGELPRWYLERQQKIADAAIPPASEEDVIEGYDRVLWLIRHYLTRVGADRPQARVDVRVGRGRPSYWHQLRAFASAVHAGVTVPTDARDAALTLGVLEQIRDALAKR